MTSKEEYLAAVAVRATMGFLNTFNKANIRGHLEKQGLSEEDIIKLTRVIYEQAAPFFNDPENVPEGYEEGEDYRTIVIYDSASDFRK